MEGHCSTGQSPQWAVVPMEEEEEEYFPVTEVNVYPTKSRNIPHHSSLALFRLAVPFSQKH